MQHNHERDRFLDLKQMVLSFTGRSYTEKADVRALLRKDENFWATRPMTEQMKRVAAGDVRYLPGWSDIFLFVMYKSGLTQLVLWRLRTGISRGTGAGCMVPSRLVSC
jgi:hypothetical protein